MSINEQVAINLRESGWSEDGIAFIVGRLHEPRMYNTFKGFHGQPIKRTPGRTKERISAGLRKQVFERDAYRCQVCGTWRDLTLDHIHPESLGGMATIENLRTLCRPCNSRKGARV